MTKEFYPSCPILIVDDDPAILLQLEILLKNNGLNNILACGDSGQVSSLLTQQPVSAVLLDLVMPHLSGEDILTQIQQEFPQIPVIIVTGTEEVETAVRCIKLGAYDYVVKPSDLGRLPVITKSALAVQELNSENLTQRESRALVNPSMFIDIVTNNTEMLTLFRYAELIAKSSEPVLITGETGVGKELMVRVIHELSGRTGPLVTVNVAGLDDNMFSDTLFGHSRGAFTGAERGRKGLVEQASEGTLFLDEIGDLAPASQAKLLRLLQDGDYLPLGQDQLKRSKARIISATNRDLWTLAHQDDFRKDLNFRLRTHHINIPPLRKRREDVPLLIQYFLDKAAKELKCEVPVIPSQWLDLLQDYTFPGNIRELRSLVYNALSITQGHTLSAQTLRHHLAQSRQDHPNLIGSDFDETQALDFTSKLPTLKEATELIIKEALQRANGNQSLAGQMLGISQQAVSKRLRSLKQEQYV